jgi:GNAT superfamily N-acetyltransferase
MPDSPSPLEAVSVYFEAKALLFQDVPAFHILEAGPLKCLHRHPGWPEVDAFYAIDVSPADAVAAIRNYQPQASHMLTVFTPAPEALLGAYRGLGYQPIPATQPFMLRPLADVPPVGDKAAVQARRTATTVDYWIEADGQPVCWGRSMMTSRQAIYVSGMETLPAYRRRGLAAAILRRIHADAAALGATRSVLCSSPMGLPLYQAAGYDLLAQMQAFVPQG